jgi:hypothetical protein
MAPFRRSSSSKQSCSVVSPRRLCLGVLVIGAFILWADTAFWTGSSSLDAALSALYESLVETRPNFTTILIDSGSDKYRRHHYERYYERWFSPIRDQPGLKLLEIGANQGHSLKLWSDFFPQASIILGLGYGRAARGVEEKVENLPKVTIYRGDQSAKDTMDYLNQRGPWDIIIDDGSHVPEHMIFSLFHLWKSVTPGGLYIIEDLETNYWSPGKKVYGYTLTGTGIDADANHSAVTKLVQLQHVLMRHQLGATELSVMPGDDTICSMEWGMNLVLLRKCGLRTDGQGPDYLGSKGKVNVASIYQWVDEAKASNPK